MNNLMISIQTFGFFRKVKVDWSDTLTTTDVWKVSITKLLFVNVTRKTRNRSGCLSPTPTPMYQRMLNGLGCEKQPNCKINLHRLRRECVYYCTTLFIFFFTINETTRSWLLHTAYCILNKIQSNRQKKKVFFEFFF